MGIKKPRSAKQIAAAKAWGAWFKLKGSPLRRVSVGAHFARIGRAAHPLSLCGKTYDPRIPWDVYEAMAGDE